MKFNNRDKGIKYFSKAFTIYKNRVFKIIIKKFLINLMQNIHPLNLKVILNKVVTSTLKPHLSVQVVQKTQVTHPVLIHPLIKK